ncbi:MAG TPA: Hsp20/alpha crystallin family protein [Polyangia bacterium]|nr:Hsp20/alpha crystallin family protein [Polyangia bacterium]
MSGTVNAEGNGERVLAERYRHYAMNVEDRWPRMAKLLKAIAERYDSGGTIEKDPTVAEAQTSKGSPTPVNRTGRVGRAGGTCGGTGFAQLEVGDATVASTKTGEMTMADIAIQKRGSGEAGAVARRDWDPFRVVREMLRWDPFREMAPVPAFEVPGYSPAFEVKETKDGFVFKADLPGTREQDVEVNVVGNRLTISGKREAEKEDKGDTFYTYERSYGSFTRTFTLPEQTDSEHVKAELKSGELTVVVPKTPAAVAKRVPVASGDKPKA